MLSTISNISRLNVSRLFRSSTWIVLTAFVTALLSMSYLPMSYASDSSEQKMRRQILEEVVATYNKNRILDRTKLAAIDRELKPGRDRDLFRSLGILLEGSTLPMISLSKDGKFEMAGIQSHLDLNFSFDDTLSFQIDRVKVEAAAENFVPALFHHFAKKMLPKERSEKVLPKEHSRLGSDFSLFPSAYAEGPGSNYQPNQDSPYGRVQTKYTPRVVDPAKGTLEIKDEADGGGTNRSQFYLIGGGAALILSPIVAGAAMTPAMLVLAGALAAVYVGTLGKNIYEERIVGVLFDACEELRKQPLNSSTPLHVDRSGSGYDALRKGYEEHLKTTEKYCEGNKPVEEGWFMKSVKYVASAGGNIRCKDYEDLLKCEKEINSRSPNGSNAPCNR